MNAAAATSLGMKSNPCPVTKMPTPNVTRTFGSGIHVSYNRSSAIYGSHTTAIVVSDRVFFVLKGNHAEAICTLIEEGGATAWVDYFSQNIAMASDYGDHLMAVGLVSDLFALMPSTVEVIGQAGVERIADAAKKFLAEQSQQTA